MPKLCLKNSNAYNGSVNPHTAKLYRSNQILIESTIPNSSSMIRMISLFCCLFPVFVKLRMLFISLVILLVISLAKFKRFLIRNYSSKHFRDGLACKKMRSNHINDRQNYQGLFRLKISFGFHGLPSLKTISGRQDIENVS